MLNNFRSVARPLAIISICVFIYFVVFPDDMLRVTTPIAALFNVSRSISPWLYGVIAVVILAFTITKVWGTKQDVQH